MIDRKNDKPSIVYANAYDHVARALVLLGKARDRLVLANAPKAAARVRRALKSAEGALRNASRRHSVAKRREDAALLTEVLLRTREERGL